MTADPKTLNGSTLVGSDGDEIGTIDAVYVDTESGLAEWAGLRRERSGNRLCLVPLTAAEERGGSLRVPYTAEQVESAPPYEIGRHLSPEDEAMLFSHYGLAHDRTGAPAGSPVARPGAGAGSEPGERDPSDRLRMYWG